MTQSLSKYVMRNRTGAAGIMRRPLRTITSCWISTDAPTASSTIESAYPLGSTCSIGPEISNRIFPTMPTVVGAADGG